LLQDIKLCVSKEPQILNHITHVTGTMGIAMNGILFKQIQQVIGILNLLVDIVEKEIRIGD
jgi:hypothetical protein